MERTTTTMGAHRGPSLLALGIVFTTLFLASLVLGTALAGGAHFPSPFAPDAAEWFARNRTAVVAGAFLQARAARARNDNQWPTVSKAIFDGVSREAGIMLFAGKSLLLGGGNNFPIANQGGSAVVIICRDPKNAHH